jgi:hypothetical protein
VKGTIDLQGGLTSGSGDFCLEGYFIPSRLTIRVVSLLLLA